MRRERRIGVRASIAMLMGGYVLGVGCVPDDFLQSTWESTLTAVVDAVVVGPALDAITDAVESEDEED